MTAERVSLLVRQMSLWDTLLYDTGSRGPRGRTPGWESLDGYSPWRESYRSVGGGTVPRTTVYSPSVRGDAMLHVLQYTPGGAGFREAFGPSLRYQTRALWMAWVVE